MKRLTLLLITVLLFSAMTGCCNSQTECEIAATTLPVYTFTSALCQGTDIRVGQLVTENVSCLHDYTLQVSQMRMLEFAQVVVISGAGLEDFLEDVLTGSHTVIDASANVQTHGHEHTDGDHHHDHDPHIWLSPENAQIMVKTICTELTALYPQNRDVFAANQDALLAQLTALQHYADETLAALSCRDLITFHDGFSYFAESFHLNILHSVEEEAGSEASAAELKNMIGLVADNDLPAVFIEKSGSDAAAKIISAETGAKIYTLDMGMSGSNYFETMYHNINTIKEALG